MKVGMVGYKKPEVESLLQAYAVKRFLKDYNVECLFTEQYSNDVDKATASIDFLKNEIGIGKREDIAVFLMINYKAFLDMYNTEASFMDFYQRSFGLTEVISEALLLQQATDYDEIAKKIEVKAPYLLLDCMTDRSPIVSLAQRYAKAHGLEVVAMIEDSKYNRISTRTVMDPKEYIGLVKEASFIVTDSFMSLYFAIIYHKNFLAQDNPALPGKNKRLMSRLNLLKHYIGKEERDLSMSYAIDDINQVEKLMHQIRAEAANYLFECLPPVVKDCEVSAPPKIMQSECCGCFACKEICPEGAIKMVRNHEGFYYPQVNDSCIHCNLCVDACIKLEHPQTVIFEPDYPKAYCAINNIDELRKQTTSGGVFPLIAQYVIEQKKGVVVGAAYDEDLNVVPTIATNMEQVKAFYGMKYVKAELEGVYPKVKQALENNQYVVYTGLPCECAGLKAFLQKDYEKLFIIDKLCRSAPSPKVFKKYVEFINNKYNSKVTNIRFRDKSKGWLIYKTSIVFEFADRKPLIANTRRNNYFRNYMNDNISMPGCSKCSFLVRNRVGDMTLGDFWGIDKVAIDMFDNNGASLVLVNTKKGADMLSIIKDQLRIKQTTIGQAFKYNNKKPMKITKERNQIFQRLDVQEINDLLKEFNDLKTK